MTASQPSARRRTSLTTSESAMKCNQYTCRPHRETKLTNKQRLCFTESLCTPRSVLDSNKSATDANLREWMTWLIYWEKLTLSYLWCFYWLYDVCGRFELPYCCRLADVRYLYRIWACLYKNSFSMLNSIRARRCTHLLLYTTHITGQAICQLLRDCE